MSNVNVIFNALLRIILIASIIGIVACVIIGLGKLNRSESEVHYASLCHLPYEVLFKYEQIARTHAAGEVVAGFWLALYLGDHSAASWKLNWLQSNWPAVYTEAIELQNRNFDLSTPLAEHDTKDINIVIKNMKSDCAEMKRRASFKDRAKESFNYMLYAALLGWIAYGSNKLLRLTSIA